MRLSASHIYHSFSHVNYERKIILSACRLFSGNLPILYASTAKFLKKKYICSKSSSGLRKMTFRQPNRKNFAQSPKTVKEEKSENFKATCSKWSPGHLESSLTKPDFSKKWNLFYTFLKNSSMNTKIWISFRFSGNTARKKQQKNNPNISAGTSRSMILAYWKVQNVKNCWDLKLTFLQNNMT